MPRMEGTTLHAIIAPTKKAEVQVAAPAAPVTPKPKPADPAAPTA
jgi:translation initiation factor IF-3